MTSFRRPLLGLLVLTACFSGLGGLLLAQGAYEDARPLVERALAISEKVLGPEHPSTASALRSSVFRCTM